tara:strand:- start:5 stop:349 length:345 start_codon:yes stop_codon:yes gene_type:complete
LIEELLLSSDIAESRNACQQTIWINSPDVASTFWTEVFDWGYRDKAAAHHLISETTVPPYVGGWSCNFLMSFADELIIPFGNEHLKFWPWLDQTSLILLNIKSHSYPAIIGIKE